jgi:hypothetical protein
MGSPGSRARCFRTCTRSTTAQDPSLSRANDNLSIAFRLRPHRRHPGLCTFSRVNTRPVRTPINASAITLLPPPHDSGPAWIATPSPYGSFLHYTSPVLTGALGRWCRACTKFRPRDSQTHFFFVFAPFPYPACFSLTSKPVFFGVDKVGNISQILTCDSFHEPGL